MTDTIDRSEGTVLDRLVVRFAGDSGDGMQLTGMQFTDSPRRLHRSATTSPPSPTSPLKSAHPAGTVAGVSGFQVNFADNEIFDALATKSNAFVRDEPGRAQSQPVGGPARPAARIIVNEERVQQASTCAKAELRRRLQPARRRNAVRLPSSSSYKIPISTTDHRSVRAESASQPPKRCGAIARTCTPWAW